MAQQTLDIGSNANDGTGDTLRAAMIKVNENFTEIYASPLIASGITVSGNEIYANRSNDDLKFIPSGTGAVSFPAIRFNDNNIEGLRSNEDINLIPGGTGSVTFGALKFQGNNITGTRSNENINLIPAGTGGVVIGALKFAGTTLSSDDSSIININEGLIVDGTANVSGTTTLTGAVTASSTLAVTGAATLSSTLAVTGATTLTTTTIDNLTIQDNTISSASNADINITPGGTGDVVLSSLRVNGTTLDSSDSTKVTIAEAVDITGALVTGTSLNIAGDGATVTGIKDEDGMDANSATKLATQQSIKAYVDAQVTASDLDFQGDSGGALSIDLDSESLTIAGGTNITTTGSGNTITIALDSALSGVTINNSVIGGSTPAAGTFTTLTANTSAVIDGVTLTDNTISSNASNANLYLTGNGSGGVRVSGFTLPTSDGSSGQFIATNGLGVLSFATAGATLNYSDIADATTTVGSSAVTVLNTFAHATYRSAKYFISIADATNSRYEIVEVNVVHDGSAAYVASFGSVTDEPNEPRTAFTAAINGSNVELRVQNITSDNLVFKFQRIAIDV